MHGQKLGQWVRQRAAGLPFDPPSPQRRRRWHQRHRAALLLCVLAISLLAVFWLVRGHLSYPAHIQSALRGEIREIHYEIHPGLWVRVTEADAITQIAGWLADARGGNDWGNPSNTANCQMRIRMADGRLHTLWLSPTGPLRAADGSLQPNYYLAEIHWGAHRRFNHAQLGISEIYRRLPATARPDPSLLPLAPLPPGGIQPSTGPAGTQPTR